MPSDPRFSQALDAMAQPIAEFRAIVQGAIAQGEGYLAEQAADAPTRAAHAATTLGQFGIGRIDAGRFAALFPSVVPVTTAGLDAMRAALTVLRALAARGNEAFLVTVPVGGRLGDYIGQALAEIGRAFGAVIVADLVRGGRYQPAEHERLLSPLEFRAWTRTERRFAPPLLVSVHGADLQASALGEFSDGREKIVLLVEGASPPAPLARCITPGTLVLQTMDGSGLERVASFDGPALAAVVPEGAATFLHDPTAGREPWQRLTVRTLGATATRAIGGVSVWQMGEDQRMLGDLARTPFAIPVSGGAATPAVGADEAVDRIASWLLGQSGMPPR
jgi:hypothetical protein